MEWHAEISYRVPYGDTDQMRVVYYANYLVYFERVRNEVLRNLGLSYQEMEAAGYHLPVRKAHCDYHRPARYDDLLTFRGRFRSPEPGIRVIAECEVWRDDERLASGYTEHVCVTIDPIRPVRLPEQLLTLIKEDK